MKDNNFSTQDKESLPEVGKTRLAEYKAIRKKVDAKAERLTRKRTEHAERRVVVWLMPHVLEAQEENLACGISHDLAQPARLESRNLF